jgi:hypothetical protein
VILTTDDGRGMGEIGLSWGGVWNAAKKATVLTVVPTAGATWLAAKAASAAAPLVKAGASTVLGAVTDSVGAFAPILQPLAGALGQQQQQQTAVSSAALASASSSTAVPTWPLVLGGVVAVGTIALALMLRKKRSHR